MSNREKNPDQGIWKHIFRYFVKITGWLSAVLYLRPKYYYEDKKVQKRKIKGKAIIISNHISGWDVVLYTVVFIRRYLRCIAGEEVYQHRSLRFFLNAFGTIKAVRSSMQQDYIYQAINTLNRGGVIEIYPEAHFGSDKKIQPFKTSYIVMAAQTGAPIITCYQTGEHNFFKRPKIAIAKHIYTKDYFNTPNPSLEQLDNLNKIIEDKMQELKRMVNN